MANSARKIQEGLGHIKEAEKYLKTSFFKWSPDYDSAADRYNKAAVCFKVARSHEKAKDAFKKTAECYESNGQLFHAAKALTEAANISADLKNYKDTMILMQKACLLYREHGTPDTACINLVTLAKMIEGAVPLEAINLYEKAAEIAENDEKFRESANHLNNASRLLIKSAEYLKAGVVMKKQVEIYAKVENYPMIYNIVLGQVLVYLMSGDLVAAENCYKNAFEFNGFALSDAAEALEKILEAYSSGDNKTLKLWTSKPIVNCQEIAVARLGKLLKAPEGGGGFDEFAPSDDQTEEITKTVKQLEIKDEELEEGIC